MPGDERILDLASEPARLSLSHQRLIIRREDKPDVAVPLMETAVAVLAHPRITCTGAAMAGVMRHGGSLIVCDETHAPVGLMLPLSCEPDFVAKPETFQKLAKDLAMHIAAMKPLVVSEDELDPELVAKEESFARKQALEEGKPEHIVDRIVEGRVAKAREEWALVNQPFVLDDSRTVAEVVSEVQALVGERVEVARFARFEVGG